ncbi:hypothetical protein OIM90_21380 [Streptomyces sp. AD16]|nr:hypothetical protein OIM90_21380 [Streptomyces sp. AD16]
MNGHGATGTGDGPADSGRERTRNGHGPTSSRHEPPGTAPGGAPRSPRPRPRLARTSEGTRTETGRATPPSCLTPSGRTARHLPPTPPTLYAGHTTHPGPTASALADDVPAPSPRVQLNALQALCRQVFGVRLALIALGAPFALQNAADGAARYLVLTAAVTGFMASYAMLRDWERFGPLVLRHPALLGLDLLIGAVLLLTASPASPSATPPPAPRSSRACSTAGAAPASSPAASSSSSSSPTAPGPTRSPAAPAPSSSPGSASPPGSPE